MGELVLMTKGVVPLIKMNDGGQVCDRVLIPLRM